MTRFTRFTGLAIVGVLLVSLLISCQGKRHRHLIPAKKFVDVLVDLHLVEAIGHKLKDPDQDYRPDSAALYGSVFDKYGVTMAMFDSTMSYYSQRPDKFQKLYNAVTVKLKLMEEELLKAQKEMETDETEVIWEDPRVYRFPPLQSDRIEISVPLRGPGIYIVSATVKLFPEDLSLSPRMSLYFFRDSTELGSDRMPFDEIMFTARNGKESTYRAVKRLNNPQFSQLKGFIANFSNRDTLFTRNMIVSEIKVSMRKEKKEGERE